MGTRIHSYLLSFILIFLASVNTRASIYINEILASNTSVKYDPHFFNFCDWIEIYNSGNDSVNLKGYTITDDILIPDKYLVNYTLIVNPHGYTVLWADSESWYPHTNFSLDSDGEFVALFDPEGTLVDSISFGKQFPDISYGRYPDGSPDLLYLPTPTWSARNRPGVTDPSMVSSEVIFSQEGGFYEGTQSITLSTLSSTASIRFTKEGSWPDEGSELYLSPISVSKNTVIRARSFEEGYLPSPVYTNSYLIGQKSTLPVFSISTDPDYFFSYHYGIYVVGNNGIAGNCIDSAVNFNQPWERAINFEYYTREGVQRVNQVAGAKIAGRCSRTRKIKSIGIYSRKKYGKEGIDGFQFFNSKELDSPKDLLLRNSGTECYSTYLRDGFMQTLVSGRMDIDYQAYQPVVVYINGEYWGIHNLREKMNEHYVPSNYGIDPESIDLLEYNTIGNLNDVLAGDWELYNAFMGYLETHDPSIPENYEYIQSQMDVDEFMNINISKIYFENEDWPQNNNKFWRERSPGGKWRWYLFDNDLGFGYWPRTENTVEWVFGRCPDAVIASKLKYNQAFRNEFIQRTAMHLCTTFRTERVLSILDSLKQNIDAEMYRHIDRWGTPWDHSQWEKNIQVMVDFAEGRTGQVILQMMQEFDLTDTAHLEIQNAYPERGRILVSGVEIPGFFSGFYFSNVPLRIRVIPEPGYMFSGWSGDVSSTDLEIFVTSDADLSLIAGFSQVESLENLYIHEIMAGNKTGLADEWGEHEDWIEIYNDNEYSVDLAGLYISDSLQFLKQYQIPFGYPGITTVPAKGYGVLRADKDTGQGVLHLACKLNKSGESVYLSQRIGTGLQIIDSLNFPKQYSDVSYGRDPGKTGRWIYLEPTPGAENLERRLENIYINEFMASNRSVLMDTDGNWDDWIELYNANDYEVNVAGVFFSDDPGNLTRYRIPDELVDTALIPPEGYLLIWADDSTEQGGLHLNFGLNNSGERIVLVQPNGLDILDSVSYPSLIGDAPYGRIVDGSGQFSYMIATPGKSNMQPSFQGLYINEVLSLNSRIIEDRPGEFDDWFEIFNNCDIPVNIGGLFLSDQVENPLKFRISTAYPDSTTISPKGHIVIWADDSREQGILHTNFGFNRDGESILLSSSTGKEVIDVMHFGKQSMDISFGRISDGNVIMGRQVPTPGEANKICDYEGIILNEIMASDHHGLQDDHGEYGDWIELYNTSDRSVDMAGMAVSDSLAWPEKFFIPGGQPELTTILPGQYLILWADDSTEQGILHLGFKLSERGEGLGIFTTDGRWIDSISFPNQYNHFSYSRLEGAQWMHIPPTPGARNIVDTPGNLFINEYMSDNENRFEDEYGEFDDWIEIYNDNEFPVDLAGLYLSDSLLDPGMYRIPSNDPEKTTVARKGYAIIWTDSDSKQGPLHTNFKLSKDGEDLVLSAYDYRITIDQWSYNEQYSNFSTGRKDDNGPWVDMPPTPGTANILPDLDKLFINEIMSSNVNIVADDFGEYDDWIEFYNAGPDPVDMGGLYLSNSLGELDLFRISSDQPDSTIIHPGEYLLIWADDSTEQGVLHAGFKLNRMGEQVILYDYSGKNIIDSVTYKLVPRNRSYGRCRDGSLPWMQIDYASPMQPNETGLASVSRPDFAGNRFLVYPNPATDHIWISMDMLQAGEVVMKVYDQTGKLLAIPVVDHFSTGRHEVTWTLDHNGSLLHPGIYLYVIQSPEGFIRGKFVVAGPG